ncbi:MAG: divalent-cation tolerance protein CutA [Cyanobacteriota bacterium]|nr:divalent-cation tolerance protein CutA [Cyanobacteriota bacterium]
MKEPDKMSPEYLMVITTTSSRQDADNIAKYLLEKRLAACIQIFSSITSSYWWNDEICTDEEWLCLIKTSQKNYESLEKAIREIHPYETPEVIALPILTGSQDYLSWLGNQLENN